MKNLIQRFARDESGATAIEYALLAGLVGVALVPGLTALQLGIDGAFTEVTAAL
ncbi:MAG: Flp family type IVb pilin [Hyphomicrobium sp.]|nr:MAG: Flp family type IVb pilin [Hyphomicrobium sp.]